MRKRLLTLLVTTVAPAVVGYVVRTIQSRRQQRKGGAGTPRA